MKAQNRRLFQSILSACCMVSLATACAATLGDSGDSRQNSEVAASELSNQKSASRTDAQGDGRHHSKVKRGRHRDAAGCNKTECTPQACTTVEPTNALITDWRDVDPNGMFVDSDSYQNPGPEWWLGFFGGPYVYPAFDPCSNTAPPEYPLTQRIDGALHVQGKVGTWSGFGVWFAPCMVDLSAYRGISIEIWGSVGETRQVTFFVLTNRDSEPTQCMTNVGTCDPTAGSCSSPGKAITVPATPGEPVTVLWSELTGGSPVDGVDSTEIVGLLWAFQRVEWGGVVTPPFPVDVNLGTLQLVP